MEWRFAPAAPVALSIDRATPALPNTSAASVVYAVAFDQSVTGVDAADFKVTSNGTLTAGWHAFADPSRRQHPGNSHRESMEQTATWPSRVHMLSGWEPAVSLSREGAPKACHPGPLIVLGDFTVKFNRLK